MAGIFLGLRASEFLHTPHAKKQSLDRDGDIRQFLRKDITFMSTSYVGSARLVPAAPGAPDKEITAVRVHFRNQKNGDNVCFRDFHRSKSKCPDGSVDALFDVVVAFLHIVRAHDEAFAGFSQDERNGFPRELS